MNYDQQIKAKREQITSFTNNYVNIYSQAQKKDSTAQDVMESMLVYLELKDMIEC